MVGRIISSTLKSLRENSSSFPLFRTVIRSKCGQTLMQNTGDLHELGRLGCILFISTVFAKILTMYAYNYCLT